MNAGFTGMAYQFQTIELEWNHMLICMNLNLLTEIARQLF